MLTTSIRSCFGVRLTGPLLVCFLHQRSNPKRYKLVQYISPILLLVASNVFMTFAWYGHLKFPNKPLLIVIGVSWAIALLEYCLAVPANRIGYQVYSAAQLKTIQEVITLSVFVVFSILYLGESFTVNHAIGFALIAIGAFFIFAGPFK